MSTVAVMKKLGTMKVVTLYEPWAMLLATGQKRIESRPWSTDYRGQVAIHSAKAGMSLGKLEETCFDDFFFDALDEHFPAFRTWNESPLVDRPSLRTVFPCGMIIAVGELVNCFPAYTMALSPDLDTKKERAFGDYVPSRYGLVFENVKMLSEPVPFKSRQGKLLDLPADVEDLVRGRM